MLVIRFFFFPQYTADAADGTTSRHPLASSNFPVQEDGRITLAAPPPSRPLAQSSSGGGGGFSSLPSSPPLRPPPFSLSLSPAQSADSGEYLCLVNKRRRPNAVVRLFVQGGLTSWLTTRRLCPIPFLGIRSTQPSWLSHARGALRKFLPLPLTKGGQREISPLKKRQRKEEEEEEGGLKSYCRVRGGSPPFPTPLLLTLPYPIDRSLFLPPMRKKSFAAETKEREIPRETERPQPQTPPR